MKTYTAEELMALPSREVVEIYNGLPGIEKPLAKWGDKKIELVTRVLKLLPEPKKAKAKKAKTAKAESKGRTIREAALELLSTIDYFEDKTKNGPRSDNEVEKDHPQAGSVGIPYDEILACLKDEFPDAKTSAACLRWYVVRVREGHHGYKGYDLPRRRPRQGGK